MSRRKDSHPPLKQRLGLPLWVYAGMEASGVTSINAYASKLDGRAQDDGKAISANCRRTLASYANGEHWPDVMAPSSLFGRVEALHPGTLRYVTTLMWSLLEAENLSVGAFSTDVLQRELASCPALNGCQGRFESVQAQEQSLDLAAGDLTFWTLEALVLLAAMAIKCGDRPNGLAICAQLQQIEGQIPLPKDVEDRRRELMSFCFRFMRMPWGEIEAPELIAADEPETCQLPSQTASTSDERKGFDGNQSLVLIVEARPPALLNDKAPDDANRQLTPNGRRPSLGMGVLSAILMIIFFFERAYISGVYFWVLWGLWFGVTVLAFFPKLQRWKVTA
jgi:hypothetical protein